MAAMIVSAQNSNAFVYASSDGEFEQSLQDAIEASNDDYAFHIQLQEILQSSNFSLACDCQQPDPPFSDPSSSKDEPSSSFSKDENEYMPDEQASGYGGENGESSRGKEVYTLQESRQCLVEAKKPVPLELCGICLEDAEIFEGISCFHRFCNPCMTKYIYTQLEQRRHQIYCPHESCREPLTPQECSDFLPMEIIEAWSAITLEAEIPDSQKVYCPFPDCSAMLVKEDGSALSAMEIVNAECPFCNRMFCVRCMVPWHADLACDERSEEDRQLFKLAEAHKWQRCGKCKRMIEMEYGCNHMTCRCGYEFCYGCGIGWESGRPTCNCH